MIMTILSDDEVFTLYIFSMFTHLIYSLLYRVMPLKMKSQMK